MIKPDEIISIAKKICKENASDVELSLDSSFVAGQASLDSMSLVQLCLALEDRSRDFDFDFDWTSEKAMSSMNSVFRSATSLAEEFNQQLLTSKRK